MTVVPVSVHQARSQPDLVEHHEHASASPELLAALAVELGQQVRVRRDGAHPALFTLSETRDERPDNVVRMGLGGRDRLAAAVGDTALMTACAVNSELCDADAQTRGEFVERLDDDGRQRRLIVVAPHGGDIEAHTDAQAERVASALGTRAASVWRCRGWGDAAAGAQQRWHITSTDLHPASFPLLGTVVGRGFTRAVAFHGFTPRDRTDVLIGGLAALTLKRRLRTAISAAVDGVLTVRIAGPADRFGGDDPANIVNRLTASGRAGVQIEQSLPARSGHWAAIADAVSSVYRPQSSRHR